MSKTEAPWPATPPEKILYALCAIASWSVRIWPRRLQLLLGDILGEIALLLAGYRKDVALKNFKIAFPEMTDQQCKKMLHQHFRHLGRMLLEYVISFTVRKKDLKNWLICKDTSNLDDVLAKGQGAILLASHMGPCDFGLILMALAGFPLVLVGKRTPVRWVTRLLFGLREIHGIEALPERRVVADIILALKKNKAVVFVMDQYMGPPEGVMSKFFGHETGTSQGTAVFVDRFKVPVVPTWTFRHDDGRIELIIEKSVDVEGLTKDQMTQKFNDEIEKMVRKVPEQWFWVHKRWKPFAPNRTDAYGLDVNREYHADQ
jgi:KDO2-lipid IV(A) lauroyltransferase